MAGALQEGERSFPDGLRGTGVDESRVHIDAEGEAGAGTVEQEGVQVSWGVAE